MGREKWTISINKRLLLFSTKWLPSLPMAFYGKMVWKLKLHDTI